MQNSLHEHILFLETRIQVMSDELTRPLEPSERMLIESDIHAAKLALEHYREAFALEKRISFASTLNRGQAAPESGRDSVE